MNTSLPSSSSDSKGSSRGSWLLIWLALGLALLVSYLNVALQQRTLNVEAEHFPYTDLQLQIAKVDAMLDMLATANQRLDVQYKDTQLAEQKLHFGIVGLTDEQARFAPGIREEEEKYHETIRKEMSFYRLGLIHDAQDLDHREVDPQSNVVKALLYNSHNTIRAATTRMHTVQTVLSTCSIFAMALLMAGMFMGFEQSRRRTAERIQNRLRLNNEALEQAVTERTKEIEHQAFHDKLTGLANRALFMDRISLALAKSHRTCLGTAAMFLDLDNFKLVNDSLGHAEGDRLLIAVAEKLKHEVRPGDTVARLGGDEFTILMEDLSSVEQVEEIAARILTALHKPVKLADREAFASASLGIAFTKESSTTATILMKNADTAMYRAKANGKGTCVIYEEGMDDYVIERLELETDLRKAVSNGEIEVAYQPLIDLRSGQLQGAEALARWQHPTKGLVMPNQFIPIAEETGLILPIGYWMLEEACRRAVIWQAEYRVPEFSMSVNLSGRQLQSNDVVERVSEILAKTGLKPECLKLEITESVLMANREDIVPKTQRLRDLGVKLALDDFGTGYSSLSTLSTFPIDTLKIDMAFISRLGQDEEALGVVEAIVALSQRMKMDVTGEGVETEFQMNVLRALGCQTGQGYLFAHPLTAHEFEDQLSADGRESFSEHCHTIQPKAA